MSHAGSGRAGRLHGEVVRDGSDRSALRRNVLACFVAVLGTQISSIALHAGEGAEPKLLEVTVGIQGHYQVGRWTAITGTVESSDWPVQVSVRVTNPDGNLTRFPVGELSNSGASSAQFRGLFKTGRLDGVIRIDLRTSRGTNTVTLQADNRQNEGQSSAPHVWTQQTQIWAVLGDSAGFSGAVERINVRSSESRLPVKLIELSDAIDLPTWDDALQALDLIVINSSQQVPSDVNDAMKRWVVGGGHLIVSADHAEKFRTHLVAQWLPLRVRGQSRLRNLSFLTLQVPGSDPIRVDEVDAVRFEMDYGEPIATAPDGPLWARMPYGFGRVTFLGVSLSRPPLSNWGSLPLLCERLADSQRDFESSQQRTATAQLSQTGVSDLQTQLARGLDLFSGVRQPSTWIVMGSIVMFLIVVGPLDYFIVHKLLRRPHWTWFTFPILVCVATGLAVAAARQRYPADSRANQVDLVDLDLTSGDARVQSMMSFTSPESTRYRVDAELSRSTAGGSLESTTGAMRLGWTEIPETAFRGMYRTGGLDLAKPPYALATGLDAIVDLPIMQWSSANVSATWTGSHPSPADVVRADLRDEVRGLLGTVTNQLPVPLHDWFIAYEGRVYIPETQRGGDAAFTIQPGEILDMSDHRRVEARVLKHYFIGLRNYRVDRGDKVGADAAAGRDVYDPSNRDPYTILRMVSFYRACDGGEFTTLTNQTLDKLDLSDLLPLDRAVLFCRLDDPAITYSTNESPLPATEHTTILRVLLPVQTR